MTNTKIICSSCGYNNESTRIACIKCDVVLDNPDNTPREPREFWLTDLGMDGWHLSKKPCDDSEYHVIEYSRVLELERELAEFRQKFHSTRIVGENALAKELTQKLEAAEAALKAAVNIHNEVISPVYDELKADLMKAIEALDMWRKCATWDHIDSVPKPPSSQECTRATLSTLEELKAKYPPTLSEREGE